MRYRAVAVASELSNAVGAVELECTPHGLFVALLGVGQVEESDQAPAELLSGTGVTVPWPQVFEARAEDGHVLLVLDPKLLSQHRLLLTEFATGRLTPAVELQRRRFVVRVATLAFSLALALILAATMFQASPETSATAALGIAALGALGLLFAGWLVDQRLAAGSDGVAVLSAFSMELARYLPGRAELFSRAPSPGEPVTRASGLQGLLPKSVLAIVITLTASALAILLVARWVTNHAGAVQRVTSAVLDRAPEPAQPAEPSPPEPQPASRQEPKPPPTRPAPTAPASKEDATAPALGDGCRCRRADSPLWAEPIPRLSILTLSQRTRLGRGPKESKRKRYLELEVAVVNNSKDTLGEIALLVLFYDRDPPPSNRRNQISNRPLFFEGPLLPGQAIKWSAEAEGTEFEIENPIAGTIGENGEDAASTNRIAELLTANHRPVRLHAAMLLTFLGDPRAREGTLSLREALREDEAPYLTRLLQAQAEVRVCRLQVSEHGRNRTGSACLQNTTSEAQPDLGLKLRGLDAPVDPSFPAGPTPTVVAESTTRIGGELAPGAGKTVRFELDLAQASPEAFEAYSDRYDLIR